MDKKAHIGILHYTAPPVVGGVEAVMQAQAYLFTRKAYPLSVIAGRGLSSAMPDGALFISLPRLDSQHKDVLAMNPALERGEIPAEFDTLVNLLENDLRPVVDGIDHLIIHNIFTKHFNLALTSALYRLIDQGIIHHAIAWCHDFSWTSSNSRSKVHPGYPWDLLRTRHSDVTYVSISKHRQKTLAGLLECDPEDIHLVYNGVEPVSLLGLSEDGMALAERLNIFSSDLIVLMPVRVTRAKNIEFALQVLESLRKTVNASLILTGPPDPHDSESMAYFESLKALGRKLGIVQHLHFVFESGPIHDTPYFIDESVVGDLYRMSDVVFMPSHREGFGMPVLEAGLAGVPVVCTNVPAAEEIGSEEVVIFSENISPADLAAQMITLVDSSQVARFRRRVRQGYTWDALFKNDIEPILLLGNGR